MNKLNNLKIEFHILQSFPVSCLNRDDVGSPKSAMIGGVNRARVSSQCWKRQVRQVMHDLGVKLGTRTKNLASLLQRIMQDQGATEEQSKDCAEKISKLISDDTLIFISDHELSVLADKARSKGYILKDKVESKKESTKGTKKDKNDQFSKEVKALLKNNENTDALDIALFGRMVAKAPYMNVEAASSFSHAISTHAVTTDVDYFTALDDLSKDENGAAHLGTAEFNSATYYRYVCLDLGILAHNLGLENIHDDLDSIKKAVETFVKALVIAVPTARQNTMSSSSVWDYAKILVREGQPLQMTFEKPVRAKGEGYLKPSIEALNEQLKSKQKLLGSLYSYKAELEWGINADYSVDDLISGIEGAL